MVPDIERIHNLAKDILEFRERLLNEIPEICPFDIDISDNVIDARCALNEVYKDLDYILVDNYC